MNIMKKISLFVLGILFCATNAWGQTPIGSGSADGINYAAYFGMVPGGSSYGMYLQITTTTTSASELNIPEQATIMGGVTGSVSQIASGAFSNCANLTTVTFAGTTPPVLVGAFANTFPDGVAIKVPSSAISAYEGAGYSNVSASGASGPATSGNCGSTTYGNESDLAWSYDADSHTLTFIKKVVFGSVYMADYTYVQEGFNVNSTCPWNAFKNEITTVVFPSDLANIGDYAFYGFSGLTSIEIPNVTTIGDLAFCNCLSLTDVTIKSTGALSIGESAFAESTERSLFLTMKTATAPTIQSNTFNNRKGLNSNPKVAVTVPSAAAKTAYESAWGTENFEFTVAAVTSGTCGTNLNWSYDNHVLTISGTGTTMTDYAYTQTIVGVQLATTTDIPWTELENDITSINFTASNLQHIGNNAFRGCAITATPTFPSSLRTIGDYAFGDCTSLSSATIPATVTSLGTGVFYNANHLTSVTFEANSQLTAISDDLFEYCKFEEITLPSGITSIGENAFASNDVIESITIPANVATIAYGAFANSDNLSTFIFQGNTPPTVPYGNVFPNVATFVAPAAVVCDYANAFGFYSPAGNAYIYKTSVDGDAVECTPSGSCGANLTWSIDLDTYVLTIEGTGPMTEYESYQDVPWIKAGLSELITEVVIEEGATTIGKAAFTGHTNLRTVSIPSTVTTIGVSAFSGCSKLKEMKVLATTPPTLATQVLFGATLYPFEGYLDISVPESAIETYKLVWRESLPQSSGNFMGQPITYDGCTMVYYPIASGKEDDVVAVCSDAAASNTHDNLELMANANSGIGTEVGQFTIARPIQANGKLNTICLPFALSASQIANSDLNGATIYAFTAEDGVSQEKLLTLSPVTSMQAGVPYFFAYTNGAPDAENLSKLVFNDVLLNTAVEEPVDLDAGTFILHGTLQPTRLNHASNYLFLGASNSLFYPDLEGTTEAEQTINPFRAYFEAKSGANHAPARFVFGRPTPTDIENVQGNAIKSSKVLDNGNIIIIRNGEKYAIDGKRL